MPEVCQRAQGLPALLNRHRVPALPDRPRVPALLDRPRVPALLDRPLSASAAGQALSASVPEDQQASVLCRLPCLQVRLNHVTITLFQVNFECCQQWRCICPV
eukprot:298655-Chlamydomonas_euryale.AAC.2